MNLRWDMVEQKKNEKKEEGEWRSVGAARETVYYTVGVRKEERKGWRFRMRQKG